MSVFSLKVNSWPLNSCHKRPLCIGDRLTGLGEDEREGDGTDGTGGETGVDAGTDCGVVGREGVALDVAGVGDECSAVKLKSFTVMKFSVCTECCSLSLRDGKCSKQIFLAADGLRDKRLFLAESGAGLITDSWSDKNKKFNISLYIFEIFYFYR